MIEWLLKLLIFAMLAPLFISLVMQVALGVAAAVLPWVIGLTLLMGLGIGIGVGLGLRRRLPPPPQTRLPRGEVPRIRRPRGIRSER